MMRLSIFLVTVGWVLAQNTPEKQKNMDQMMQPIAAQTLEMALFNLRTVPSAQPPRFEDPLQLEDQKHIQELFKEAMPPGSAAPNYSIFDERAKAAAAQYGAADPRALAALEDAATMARFHDPSAANALFDQLIKLREHEGVKSIAYWKALQRRCLVGYEQAACKRALEVRMQQPDATPLELAARALFAGPEFAAQATDLYAKVPGISPVFMAQQYRGQTLSAAIAGKTADTIRLNNLTNQFLSQADATAKKAMIPSETLQKLEAERAHPTPLASRGGSVLESAQDDVLDGFVQAYEVLLSGQISGPIRFGQSALVQAIMATAPKDDIRRQCESGDTLAGKEMMAAIFHSPGLVNEGLELASGSGYAQISMDLFRCASSGGALPVAVYASMTRYKGTFAEMIAPRQLTVMPGYAPEVGKSLRTASDAGTDAMLAMLPPQARQAFQNLPANEQTKALQAYLAKLPVNDQTRAEAARVMKDRITAMSNTGKAIRERDRSQDDPLAFLKLLQPHEVLIDIYKYRPREEDHFAAEHYLAVVAQGNASFRLVELGPAQPIDSAIVSFLGGFPGAGQSRGTVPNRPSASMRTDWKALQQLVAQPIAAALPKDAEKILISPDSSFALVPFASMFLDLGLPAAVTITPSTYDFVRFRSTPAPAEAGKALLVGGLDYGQGKVSFAPLQATDAEVKKIAELAGKAGLKTTALEGAQATRAAVVDQIRDAQLLHFATHGVWEVPRASAPAEEAFRSARIALSNANSGAADSLLTADDIVNLNLSGVQLVTLSACSSGQGRPVDGQGLLGFQTAFMAAGARSILVSLWSVPDEATSLLMQSFYGGLLQHPALSKAEALRKAQEKIRSDPRFADPRNWAAWVLVGEGW